MLANFRIKQPGINLNFFICFIKILTGILFLFQIYCIPVLADTNKQVVVMSENGIMIEIILPNGITDVVKHSDNFIMMKLNGIDISLKIDKSTVKKKIKLSERVYEQLKKEKPDTTFFEKVPDIVRENNKFSTTKTIYNNAVDKPAAVIEGTTKLNYRYVYSISIRGNKEISYEILNKFTAFKITKTRFKLDKEILFINLGMFLFGMFIIISQIIKKNLWEKSTGVITGFRTLPRITIISITYILENGKRVDAEFDVIPIGAVPYLRKEGEEVDISYSRRNPKKIDILSNKTGIIMGIFILCIAIAGTYIMIFEL